MKMKLLDYTLIASWPVVRRSASASESTPSPATVDNTRCGSEGCASDEGVLFKIRTRGEERPINRCHHRTVGFSHPAARPPGDGGRRTRRREEQRRLQRARRWRSANGRPSAGRGVIWAPRSQPRPAAVQSVAPSRGVRRRQTHQAGPLLRLSKLRPFIQRVEVRSTRQRHDLVTRVAKVICTRGAVSDVEWDGALPGARSPRRRRTAVPRPCLRRRRQHRRTYPKRCSWSRR